SMRSGGAAIAFSSWSAPRAACARRSLSSSTGPRACDKRQRRHSAPRAATTTRNTSGEPLELQLPVEYHVLEVEFLLDLELTELGDELDVLVFQLDGVGPLKSEHEDEERWRLL